ncbi:MAG TPA: hypothetical protein VGK24_21960 [Candidatus Angelobacter sp.]|jgi:hypothetical protein
MKPRWLVLAFTLALALCLAQGQNAGPNPPQNPRIPTIAYDRLWDAYTPQNVNIVVEAMGSTHYLSRNPLKPPNQAHNPFNPPDQAVSDPDFTLEFTMSAANRNKIFRLAQQANYFNGDFAFKKHTVASSGKKTLTYADEARHFETTYDYSENKAIEEITNLFQGISNTIEHGRKLQFLHRFDKLGLEAELKDMESAMEGHNLRELQVIAPTLESIAKDAAVLNIARQRAKRLLAKAGSE